MATNYHPGRVSFSAAVALATALVVTGCADDEDIAVEDPVDPQEVVTVGVSMASPGLASGIDPAEVAGAEIDLVTGLTDRMESLPAAAEIRWTPTTADVVAEQLVDGELDVAIGQLSADDLTDQVTRIGPYATVHAGLLIHQEPPAENADDPELLLPSPLASFEELADASVCVVADSIAAGAELPVATSIVEPTVTECEIGMRSGRYDAIAADDLQLAGLLTEPAQAERYELLLWSDLAAVADEAADDAEDQEVATIDEELLDTDQYWIGVNASYCEDAAEAFEGLVAEDALAQLFDGWEHVSDVEPQQIDADLTAQCQTAAS